MSRLAVRFAALALLVLPSAAPAQKAPPPDLDALVEETMRAFEVPGLALAVVADGEVVVARGYGIREIGSPGAVGPGTLFGIASNTKAFTATALGLLVEEGALEWDTRVVEVLPWFRLSDPWVTDRITVKDLLVHRSGLGLGAGDLLWWPSSDYDREEIVRRLRHLPLETSFRYAYAYDNVLYTVAGQVIEAVSGVPWEAFVAERILAPVGMDDTDVRHSAGGRGGDVATPHARVEGEVRPVKPFTSDNVNPAGGIHAGAADMAKWLSVQLARGALPGGGRLFSEATSRALWTPVTPMPTGDPPPELAPSRSNFRFYGLGFEVRDYRGWKMVRHTGGLPGYVSLVAMIPDANVGVAILTNQETPAMWPIGLTILDHYLDAPEHDWLGAFRTLAARADSAAAAAGSAAAAARDSTIGPSLPPERYAGTYTDAWYGDVEVALEDGGLVMRFTHTPSLVGDLSHWQYDTFLVRWRDRELRADALATFHLDAEGTIREATMKPASPTVDFSYDFEDLRLVPAGAE